MPSSLIESVQTVAPTLSIADRQVLAALLFAPNHSASAGQLRTILGLKAVVQVNGAMGRIGRKLYEALGTHPDGLASGEYEWWTIVAVGQPTRDRGFVWQLREDVVTGLLALGYSISGDASHNEVINQEQFIEGAPVQLTFNVYERSRGARDNCIKALGAKCSACELDFGAIYGASAAGFIHVHHIKSLASIGKQYEVNPIEDLRPVCPNCHAVIHMTDPPRTIEEIRALLSENKTLAPSVEKANTSPVIPHTPAPH